MAKVALPQFTIPCFNLLVTRTLPWYQSLCRVACCLAFTLTFKETWKACGCRPKSGESGPAGHGALTARTGWYQFPLHPPELIFGLPKFTQARAAPTPEKSFSLPRPAQRAASWASFLFLSGSSGSSLLSPFFLLFMCLKKHDMEYRIQNIRLHKSLPSR